jgi:sugar phosphate permease
LLGAFIGYAIYYFCRVNISMALPEMQKELGFNKFQLGLIVSGLQVTYGVGKFLNGVIADRTNPRFIMAIGLLLSGVANLVFGINTTLWILIATWGANGWFQSMGFPAGARLLSHWYMPKEYGRIWGIFGCSHQVGAAIIYLAGGYLVLLGWQYAFIIPSFIAILGSAFLFYSLTDVPEKIGLPSIEEHNGQVNVKAVTSDIKQSFFKGVLVRNVFRNRAIWLIGLGNMFLYIARYGITVWTPLFLSTNKGVTVTKAGWVLAIFEVVGIAGMLLAGYISDQTFKARRGPVMSIYMFLLSGWVFLFWVAPYGNLLLLLVILGLCGFLVYGPLMLVSVAAATYAGKNSAASASGFTGFWGYVGATISGVGVGAAAENYGWRGAFIFILLSGFLSGCFFAFTWKTDSKVNRAGIIDKYSTL